MCLAVPGKIESIGATQGLPIAQVNFGGIQKEIHISYTPEAQVGDYVLVHAGIALRVLDESKAQSILQSYEGEDAT